MNTAVEYIFKPRLRQGALLQIRVQRINSQHHKKPEICQLAADIIWVQYKKIYVPQSNDSPSVTVSDDL